MVQGISGRRQVVYLLVKLAGGLLREPREHCLDRDHACGCPSPLQEGDRRMKMQNMVKFPLVGMDMAPHMVKRSQSSWSLPSHWSPWRRPYGMGRDPEDYLYDLYAVCNHYGTMQGGHYTGNGSLLSWWTSVWNSRLRDFLGFGSK